MKQQPFYKTKMLIEVEVEHQFDAKQGIRIATDRLTDIPAIRSVRVITAESNFCLHEPPSDNFSPVNLG